MQGERGVIGRGVKRDPFTEAMPNEIVVGPSSEFEKCERCGGELGDFLTSIVVERRLVAIRARCRKCNQKYVKFKLVPASLLRQFKRVVDGAEPWMQVMANEIQVDKGNPLEKCDGCGGRLVDHFTCTSGGHNWEIVKARCERCGKRYVRFRRIYIYPNLSHF